MRTCLHGGDGYKWRSRNEKYLWRRLDFLAGYENSEEYLFEKIFVWKRLCKLGFSSPDLIKFHGGFYFTRQAWLDGYQATPSLNHIYHAVLQLEYLAKHGLGHADISAEHLLINRNGVFWIDWISCTTLGSIGYRGKKDYLAPEREVSGVVTEASEIYALGMLLLGWARFDSRLRKIAERAVAPNLSVRYSNFATLRADLALLLEYSPSQ